MKKLPIILFLLLIHFPALCQKKLFTEYYQEPLKKTEGNYVNDKKEGTWKYWGSDGRLERLENYSDGLLNGTYIEFYTYQYYDDSLYHLQEYLDLNMKYLMGEQKKNAVNLIKASGTYKMGKKDGEWVNNDEDGSINNRYTYSDDVLNGTYNLYFMGSLIEGGSYLNGYKNGEVMLYYFSPRVKGIRHYKNDTLDGKWIDYNMDLQNKRNDTTVIELEQNYKMGNLDGEYKKYDSKGNLDIHTYYKKNELDGQYKSYHSDGSLYEIAFYKNGQLEGDRDISTENSISHYFYKNNMVTGRFTETHKNMEGNDFFWFFYGIGNFISDSTYYLSLTNLNTTGYCNDSSCTIKVFTNEKTPVLYYTCTPDYIAFNDYMSGPFTLFKNGKRILRDNLYFDIHVDTFCRWNDKGEITERAIYDFFDGVNFSVCKYAIEYTDGGSKLYEFSDKPSYKKFYYPNGKLKIHYYNEIDSDDFIFYEKQYYQNGGLMILKKYDWPTGSLQSSVCYDQKGNKILCDGLRSVDYDSLGLVADEHFKFVIYAVAAEELILEEPIVEFVDQAASCEIYDIFGSDPIDRDFVYPSIAKQNHTLGEMLFRANMYSWGDYHPREVFIVKDIGNGCGIEMARVLRENLTCRCGTVNGRHTASSVYIKINLIHEESNIVIDRQMINH